MNPSDAFPGISAFDALRFIYENGSGSLPEEVRNADGHEPGKEEGALKEQHAAEEDSSPTEGSAPAVAKEAKQEHGDTSVTTSSGGEDTLKEDVGAFPPPRLRSLWKLIDAQLRTESGAAGNHRTRHRRGHGSVASSSGVPSGPHSPIVSQPPFSPTPPASIGARMESLAAISQVSAELVFGVFDKVVYDPEKAVQRYDDALMHFVLNSALAYTVASKRNQVPSTDSEDENTSDESDLSQRPRSLQGYGDLSFPTDLCSPTSPSSASSPTVAMRKERLLLLARYETCCEVMGMMPLSNVLDRLAGLDGGAVSSVESSTYELNPLFTEPPANRSLTALSHGGDPGGGGRESDRCGDLVVREDSKDAGRRGGCPSPKPPAAGHQPVSSPTPFSCTAESEPKSSAAPSGTSSPRIPSSSVTYTAGSPLADHHTAGLPFPLTADGGFPRLMAQSAKGGGAPSAVSALANLHAINLSDCEGLGRAECLIPLFGLLEGFSQATFLGLAGIGLTDAGATVLALLCEAHLPSLRGLDISRNPQVTDTSASSLYRLGRRQKNLCSLQLHETSISLLARAAIDACVQRNADNHKALSWGEH